MLRGVKYVLVESSTIGPMACMYVLIRTTYNYCMCTQAILYVKRGRVPYLVRDGLLDVSQGDGEREVRENFRKRRTGWRTTEGTRELVGEPGTPNSENGKKPVKRGRGNLCMSSFGDTRSAD